MYTASGCRPGDHAPSTSTRPDRLLRLLILSILFSVLLVPVADAAGYTVRPSRNLGMEPGTPVAGETVQEIDPIPFWLFLLVSVFPQLTAAPIETLLPLKGAGCLGYKRLCRKTALDSPRRLEIFNFIKENPGLHFGALLKEVSLTRGTLRYHLETLASAGMVKTIKTKGKIHFFIRGLPYSAEEEAFIIVMRNDTLRRIITYLHLSQGARTEELAEELGLSRATIYVHVKNLENLGIVGSERTGRSVQYTLADNYSRILTNHQNRSPEPAFRASVEHAG